MNWERLKNITFFGALPLLCLWLLIFFGANYFQIIFFATAFYWNLALCSRVEEEKTETRRYRFSFLKFAYRLHNFVMSRLDYLPESIVRSVSPLIFASIMAVLAPDWQPMFSIMGSLVFELALRFKEHRSNLQI